MHNLVEGKDFYYDEQHYVVFTASWHLKRGICCGNGCRHCPFDQINVINGTEKKEIPASSNEVINQHKL